MSERVLMAADDLRRALVRIAHEIVESHRGSRDLVLIGMRTRGVPLAHRLARVEELIHSLGLSTVRKSLAAVLSGGERRRLEIARAMSLRPRIILFDEPFSGIDPIAVSEIQEILRGLRASGVGILLTDNNVRETLTITDRTYIMDDGKIWIHGPPREIVADPEARARYLGHDFRLDF